MQVGGIKNKKDAHIVGELTGYALLLFLTLEQTAKSLGLSIRTFHELRSTHPLYAPDGSRTIVENSKKDMPLWSRELVELIAFARSITAQGVRQLTDDEAFEIKKRMGEKKRREYLAYIDE